MRMRHLSVSGFLLGGYERVLFWMIAMRTSRGLYIS
jgi:hypothetical protein